MNLRPFAKCIARRIAHVLALSALVLGLVVSFAPQADAVATHTYYAIRPDFRICDPPLCGGYFVSRVNKTATRCHDGREADRCYVATVDWDPAGLGDDDIAAARERMDAEGAIVRASLGSQVFSEAGALGTLSVTQAWGAEGPNQPAGTYTLVESTDIRCVTFPCPIFREHKLNALVNSDLADLGWDSSGSSPEQIDEAARVLETTRIIVVGERYWVSGPGGGGKGRTVTQYFLPIPSP